MQSAAASAATTLHSAATVASEQALEIVDSAVEMLENASQKSGVPRNAIAAAVACSAIAAGAALFGMLAKRRR